MVLYLIRSAFKKFNGNNLRLLLRLTIVAFFLGIVTVVSILLYYSKDLPDHKKLAEYEPPIMSRLYAADGTLIDEFAKHRRLYVPLEVIPVKLQNAFIAAEDSNFYTHGGIDIKSIFGAIVNNISRYRNGQNLVGASTITQQVVKNILLTKDRTLARKIKEAILSVRITNALSKERVLELYLNEIYLGYNSYGVAAAALNYFDKSLNELTLEEIAFLAALPKAPSSLDPKRNYDKAFGRRNWVLDRMLEEGFVTSEQVKIAKNTKINLKETGAVKRIDAGSFSETVRKNIESILGKESLFEEGLLVTGTLEPRLQKLAYDTLRKGIYRYDRRRGYRGPYKTLDIVKNQDQVQSENELDGLFDDLVAEELDVEIIDNWNELLAEIEIPTEIRSNDWRFAVVLEVLPDQVVLGFADNDKGYIRLADLAWARQIEKVLDEETGKVSEQYTDPITHPDQVVKLGDVLVVDPSQKYKGRYYLRQIPEVNGAIVAMNPHDGRVVAMVGGYNDSKIEFNRAVQAIRQPGSIVKPLTYLAALENNFMPTTIVIDDEIRMNKGDGTVWIPRNYSDKFYGPTPLRIGLEKSRNVTTVRLAEMVGLSKVADVFKRYEIDETPEINYSLVLGSSETNLINITKAYAMMANGGKRIYPEFIEKIHDKNGKIIYRRDQRECIVCTVPNDIANEDIVIPTLNDERESITDDRTAYQMISLLEGVVQRGTAWRAKVIKKPLAGKTGTTNDSFDAWFVGFSADLVVGVWVGYDTPRSLGEHETGSSVTVPIFVDFMKQALEGTYARPFKVPDGIKFVKIDRFTGKKPLPTTSKENIIFEALKEENIDRVQKETDNYTNHNINFSEESGYDSFIY